MENLFNPAKEFLLTTFNKKYKKSGKGKRFFPDENWELVFEDNFDFLDFSKWKYYKPVNNIRRTAYYTNDSDILFVKDSKLYIRTKWKNGKYGEGFYTAWLESSVSHTTDSTENTAEKNYNGFADKFGYYEVRCKVPKAVGIWSAFWLMPDNTVAFSENDVQGTGADGAELDVFESPFYSSFAKNCVQSAIHCDGYDERLKSDASKIYFLENPYETFHTYSVKWDELCYTFYIDGYKIWESHFLTETSKVNEYMILSTEVGGENDGYKPTSYDTWCGNALNNDKNKNYDFVVDYVRVYKQKTK